MADISLSPQAVADLADIYGRGAEEYGVDVADRYHKGLQAALARLADHPLIGPAYPGLRQPVRYLSYRRHHIYYDFDGTTVWVVRILHHALDAGRRL